MNAPFIKIPNSYIMRIRVDLIDSIHYIQGEQCNLRPRGKVTNCDK